jgi:hypothetical protein
VPRKSNQPSISSVTSTLYFLDYGDF